jgi:hypothetical protein
VIRRVNFSTWWFVETNSPYEISDLVSKDFKCNNVREDNRFEVHYGRVRGWFISVLEKSGEKRLEDGFVKLTSLGDVTDNIE